MFAAFLFGVGMFSNLQPQIYSDNSLGNSEPNETVKVELLYESFCPYCHDFYMGIFTKTVEDLLPYLDVHMYPYGNANTTILNNGTVLFKCQHGPRECYGNMLHSCVQDIFENVMSVIKFNSCLMKGLNSNTDDRVHECGKLLDADPIPIIACARSDKGVELLKANGEKSKKYKYIGVPWCLVNGEYSENNLLRDVCKALKHPPPQCE